MSKKIIVLSGGFSEEKEISRISALEIEKELISRGYETFRLDPADYGSYLLLIEEIIRINADKYKWNVFNYFLLFEFL